MNPKTVIAVSWQKIGPRGGLPYGYVVDNVISPNGLDEIRRIIRENFAGDGEPDYPACIRGILNALTRSDVRELSLKSGETLYLVESPLLHKYWQGNVETFARCQLKSA